MAQSDKSPKVLSIQEFRKEFNIQDGGLSVGKYKNGNYGWQAKLSDGRLLRGAVSKRVLNNPDESKLAFVRYYWGKEGRVLDKEAWVLQIRPTQSQIESTYSLFILLEQLNVKKKNLFGDGLPWKPFTRSELLFQLRNCKKNNSYVEFSIPKKNGKLRSISAPNYELKAIQSCLNLILQEKYHPTAAAMGFVPGRSVADNARVHQGQNYVYNIDIKDFFPSITEGRVFSILQKKPYSFSKTTASIIADLCCHNGVLPQGAPTSPILTNIICERLDWRLSKLAKQYDLNYSRYADDISFSGMENIFHKDGAFVKKLHYYVEKEGFSVNQEKTRLNTLGNRQEVTGLTVNEKPNVSKKYIKTLRTMIHNWETFGREEAQKRMAEVLQKSGMQSLKGVPQIENVVQGKLNYLKMIKGGCDSTYLKLYGRYKALVDSIYGIHDILKIWERKGFESAAKAYVDRMPFEEFLDRGMWTLSEFESIVGGKVVFKPWEYDSSRYRAFAVISRPSSKKDDEEVEKLCIKYGIPTEKESGFEVNFTDATEIKSIGNSDNKAETEIALDNIQQSSSEFKYLIPTVGNQQYIGRIKMHCLWGIDLRKEIFVSYGDYKGRMCLFFSNKKSHLIWGVLDDKGVGSIINKFRDGQYPLNVMERIMSHKCDSPEERALRTKLILKEFDSVVEELKGQIGEMQGDTEKKNNLFGVSDFLYKFNQDGILRYTCHLLDKSDVIDEINEKCGTEKYDYEKHVNLIVENWEKLSKPYSGDEPTKNIRGLINAYIKGNKAWSSENIQTSWKSPTVIEWAKNHPGIILTPDLAYASKQGNRGYKLEKPFQSKFTGKRVAYFSELVLHFKTFFHIKGGNDLHKILERQDWSRKGVEISFSTFEDNNEMFTDVDKLLQACELIIDMAVKASNEKQLGVPKIEFSLMEDSADGLLALSIHHTNSVYGRGYTAMNRLGDSLNRLRKIMQGVCVIYIQADCGEGKYGELNLLDGNIPAAKEISQMTGVKYILKFKLKFQ